MSGFSLRNMPRKRRVGIGLVAFFLVAAPSLFFLYRAFHHESLEEATAALNAALAARDMEQLNRYIDFNMLSLGFADAILEVKNSDKRDGDERRAISEAVQKELLAAPKLRARVKRNRPLLRNRRREPPGKKRRRDQRISPKRYAPPSPRPSSGSAPKRRPRRAGTTQPQSPFRLSSDRLSCRTILSGNSRTPRFTLRGETIRLAF